MIPRKADPSRPNVTTAVAVSDGIRLHQYAGRYEAARFMLGERVPVTVIARVLVEPKRRRM